MEIQEYLDANGRSPFAKWFNRLNAQAAAKVATALIRMEQGNLSNVKSVGPVSVNIAFRLEQDTGCILAATAKVLCASYRQRKQQEDG